MYSYESDFLGFALSCIKPDSLPFSVELLPESVRLRRSPPIPQFLHFRRRTKRCYLVFLSAFQSTAVPLLICPFITYLVRSHHMCLTFPLRLLDLFPISIIFLFSLFSDLTSPCLPISLPPSHCLLRTPDLLVV